MAVLKSFRLTVQERILLHLNEYSKYIDQIEVPFALTQEGIAESVGVVRSAIPRAMKKLMSKNQVKEVLAHVFGVSRRRKVYYLTMEGIMSAQEIKNKLLSKDIKLINEKNETIHCKVKDVPSKLGHDLTILDIVLNLDSENVYDFPKVKDQTKAEAADAVDTAETAGTVKTAETADKGKSQDKKKDKSETPGTPETQVNKYFIDKAPKITYFIGRKTEMEIINNALTNDECKIITIYGIAGIGKTTLAVKLLNELYDESSLFWYRFHEWDTVRNLLTALSRFLEKFGRTQVRDYLESNQNIDMTDVGELLETELKDLNALLFFDDFHKINEQIIDLFTLFREILERITGVRFLVFSRSFVPIYDRRDVLIKQLITELELSGLNEKESKELLEHRNIKMKNFKEIYKFTDGHPLSLELLDPEVDLHEQSNINLYLEEEVLARLSLREKSLLKIASVFRYPVPAEGLFIYEKAQFNRETLSHLARKSLIKESREGYEVHDLIHDFFYSYLTTQEKVSYHKRVGKFYMTRLKIINDLLKKKISSELLQQLQTKSLGAVIGTGNGSGTAARSRSSLGISGVDSLLEQRARGILEAQFHFMMAEDFNRAAEVAVIMGHELLNVTYAEELLDNLEKIEPNYIDDGYYMDLKILKGDAFKVLGDIDHALNLYQQSMAIAEAEDNKPKLAELYRKLGFIKEKQNEYESAIEFLNKSLGISRTIGDTKSVSDAYGGLGDIYWKMSDYDKSNGYYKKCLESAEGINDLPDKARRYLSLGIQSAKHGQFEESIQYYERCLDILEKTKLKGIDDVDYTNFYQNLGDHYLKSIFSYYIQSNGK